MSRKHKKVFTTLNCIEHFLILASTITGCILFSAFASLLGISIGITSSAIGLKMCAIAAGIKNSKSIIKRKEKKHDKILFSVKSKLNKIEVLISKSLIDSNFSHDEFALINNVLKEYDEMKEEAKNIKIQLSFGKDFILFIKQGYHIVFSVEKIQKVKIQKL